MPELKTHYRALNAGKRRGKSSSWTPETAKQRAQSGQHPLADPTLWQSRALNSWEVDLLLMGLYPAITENAELCARVESLGTHAKLLLDPGIACRFDAFVEFAGKWVADNPEGSSVQLRRAFGRSLESLELYRAIAVPREDAQALTTLPSGARAQLAWQRGYRVSPSLRPHNRDASMERVERLFDKLTDFESFHNWSFFIDKHVNGDRDGSLLTSYSMHREVAQSVVSWNALNSETPQTVVVVTAQVPALDVILPTGLLDPITHVDPHAKMKMTVEGKTKVRAIADDDVEVFTFLRDHGTVTGVDVHDPEEASLEWLP